MTHRSEKREHSAILAVTVGTMLEWYEIYLYIYWAPILSQLFFDRDSELANLINTILIFAVGFLARPFGGILFGRVGDKIGRKRALVLSIVTMILPTFIMGIIPTYKEIGWGAPAILVILRLLQSLPAGGELPGVFCYLYECTTPRFRRYTTSWGAVGNQVGILVSMVECYLLERFLTPEALVGWGWRFSFMLGGLIGLFGFYLRIKLQETPLYQDLEKHHQVTRVPVFRVLGAYKKQICMGILFCTLNSVGFYLLSVLFPVYFGKILNISYQNNILISMLFLVIATVPLPFLGMIGDRVNNKLMLIVSASCILLLIYPMYYSIEVNAAFYSGVISVIIVLFFACLTALIPYRFADLFPTPVRFTCVGLSYNIVDGIIGGFSPLLALFLFNRTGSISYFYWILLASGLISLLAFTRIRERKYEEVG